MLLDVVVDVRADEDDGYLFGVLYVFDADVRIGAVTGVATVGLLYVLLDVVVDVGFE